MIQGLYYLDLNYPPLTNVRHSSHPRVALFLDQTLVEMIVSRTHLRALDRIGYFRRQIIDPVDAALEGAKPLQLFEFACGYEVPAHPDRGW